MKHSRRPAVDSRRRVHPMTPNRLPRALVVLAVLMALSADRTLAQYSLVSPAGQEVEVPREVLLQLDDTTRALRANLEEDPRVLYYTAFGDPTTTAPEGAAYPWSAVEVVTDSTIAVVTPADLREADRAYANYAVLRMQAVRGDPDVSCDSVFALEERAVSGFVDGWVVSRTLYGGPPYPLLDELFFAREAGHLGGLMAARSNRQLGGCLGVWVERHADRLAAYERWRLEEFLDQRSDADVNGAAEGAAQAGHAESGAAEIKPARWADVSGLEPRPR